MVSVGLELSATGIGAIIGAPMVVWGGVTVGNGIAELALAAVDEELGEITQVTIAKEIVEVVSGNQLIPEVEEKTIMAVYSIDIALSCASITGTWKTAMTKVATQPYLATEVVGYGGALVKTKSEITMKAAIFTQAPSILLDLKAVFSSVQQISE